MQFKLGRSGTRVKIQKMKILLSDPEIEKCGLRMRIRFRIYSGVCNKTHVPRVADPVHFRPDPNPDPANQNFKIRIRILLALISINLFSHINQISSNR